MTHTGGWVSLFSGGKDSSWALYRALERDLPVARLLTVHPGPDSYMYHVPATDLTGLAAEAIGLPLTEITTDDLGAADAVNAGAQGDREVEHLADALAALDDEIDGGLAGVIVGAVESAYQADRVERVADELGCDVFAPLWHEAPRGAAEAMLAAGFDVRIVQVAAAGLDRSWLGRRFDSEALADLQALNDEYGVHVLGEGGEFETLVVDGPHMERAIEYEAEPEWEGTRGRLRITDAWLAE
jgi:ABC transporter with metal-binding/Fe-S-binding domain ATP-binding protein